MYLDTQLCYLPKGHNTTSLQQSRHPSLESAINAARCFAGCVDEVREGEERERREGEREDEEAQCYYIYLFSLYQ